jgi:hypothetical protein
MHTNLWYDLELMGLAGGSAVEELIRDAEAAQFSAEESTPNEADGDQPDA